MNRASRSGLMLDSYMRVYPTHDVLSAQCARLSCHFTTSTKEHDRWDALNTESGGQGTLFFCIDLCKTKLRLQRLGRLVICRRHHLARPAPRGPEIHDQRDVAARRMDIEISFSEWDRMPGEQRLSALPARWMIAQPLRRDAIRHVALRTNDTRHVLHRSGLEKRMFRWPTNSRANVPRSRNPDARLIEPFLERYTGIPMDLKDQHLSHCSRSPLNSFSMPNYGPRCSKIPAV